MLLCQSFSATPTLGQYGKNWAFAVDAIACHAYPLALIFNAQNAVL